MKKQPLVSVILSTYNGEKHIKKAIESILEQTYKNIEVIIIDDGSTDRTKEVVWSYLVDNRVHYIYQKNQGVSKARNNGIMVSKGKYIALIDDDDIWYDQKKLEKQVGFLEDHPDYTLVGGGVIVMDRRGKELFRYFKPKTNESIQRIILFKCPFASSSVLFKKNALEKVGLYKKTLFFGEDWEFWMRLGKTGKFYNFSEYFIKYRVYQENISSKYPTSRLGAEIIKIIKLHKKDYPNYYKALIYNYVKFLFFRLPFSQRIFKKFLSIKYS